jgi:hypothetical protein
MPDSGVLGRGKHIRRRRGEELHHRVIVESGRIGDVDDDAGQDVYKSFAGEGVDTRPRRRRDCVVASIP